MSSPAFESGKLVVHMTPIDENELKQQQIYLHYKFGSDVFASIFYLSCRLVQVTLDYLLCRSFRLAFDKRRKKRSEIQSLFTVNTVKTKLCF